MRSRLMWVLTTVLLIVAVTGTMVLGGHRRGAAQAQASHVMTRGNGESIDWNHPLLNGVQEPSLTAGQANLAFSPVAPQSLGNPSAIWQTAASASADPKERLVVVVYADSPYGPLWLEESPGSEAGIGPALVKSCLADSGCEADRVELVTLADGSQASVQRKEGSIQNARWDRGGVMYSIMGQADSLSWDQAIALANEVAKATASAAA